MRCRTSLRFKHKALSLLQRVGLWGVMLLPEMDAPTRGSSSHLRGRSGGGEYWLPECWIGNLIVQSSERRPVVANMREQVRELSSFDYQLYGDGLLASPRRL